MKNRVTLQDIADALGISRNTVSKAINNSEGIAAATRDTILQKAVEMGYKQFSYVWAMNESDREPHGKELAAPGSAGEIALLTSYHFEGSHFALTMIDRLRLELASFGYTIGSYYVSQEDLKQKQLPYPLPKEDTRAFICFEIFDWDYADMLCALEMPLLFVDAPSRHAGRALAADCILMDSMTELTNLIHNLVGLGKDRFGFIGDITHCQSFFERYVALTVSMALLRKPIAESQIISSNDPVDIYYALANLEQLPDLFICANDSIAIDVIRILQKLGKSVPEDVMVCGFDDSEEARHMSPTLTTVHIHTQSMANHAVHLLLSRIKEPTMPFRTAHLQTDLVERESTRLCD